MQTRMSGITDHHNKSTLPTHPSTGMGINGTVVDAAQNRERGNILAQACPIPAHGATPVALQSVPPVHGTAGR